MWDKVTTVVVSTNCGLWLGNFQVRVTLPEIVEGENDQLVLVQSSPRPTRGQDLRKVQKFVGKGDSCKGGKISKNVFNLAISPKIGAIQCLRRQNLVLF